VSGQRLFLYGTSYGTYWLQRFLQLYPDEVDGVVLDSICPAGSCYLDRYDRWNDSVGGQLLDACAEDPVCGPKLATLAATPRAALAQTYARLAAGELCPAIADRLDRDQLRVALTGLLLSWSQRVLIPPVIYRLDRCGDHDVAALERLFGLAAAPPPPVDEARVYDAPALRDHVLQSELLAGDAVAELEAFAAQALFTADVSLNEARLRETGLWPVYADPDHAQKLATTATPLLMLNGTTDPQTPLELARAAGEHFTGPHQTFVAIPHATHGTVIFSPVDRPLLRDGSPPCGLQLIAQFLADPTAELDRSCVDAVYPLEFSGDSENNRTTSEESLGTPDMWEG